MGFDITLVYSLSGEFSLNDDVCFLESLLSVTKFVLYMAGDIALHASIVAFEEAVVGEMGA